MPGDNFGFDEEWEFFQILKSILQQDKLIFNNHE